jgi:ubiquitin-protein ligase E3 A
MDAIPREALRVPVLATKLGGLLGPRATRLVVQRFLRTDMFSILRHPYMLTPAVKHQLMHASFDLRRDEAGTSYTLKVQRDNILQTALTAMGKVPPARRLGQMRVRFKGEEGVDAGGLIREFFTLLAPRLVDAEIGMFRRSEGADKALWFASDAFIESSFVCHPDIALVGTLVGSALYNGAIMELNLSVVVYKKLLGLPLNVEDLREVEPQIANGLDHILMAERTDAELAECEFTFSVDYVIGNSGALPLRTETHSLIDNGSNVCVTLANREEYAAKLIDWHLVQSVRTCFTNFKNGFDTFQEALMLTLPQPHELRLMVEGVNTPAPDMGDLKSNSLYVGYTAASNAIRWFWNIVDDMDADNHCRVLLFATASHRAPLGGFANLTTGNFTIEKVDGTDDRYPCAHTCFNKLDMPEYSSRAIMKDRLTTAISQRVGYSLM